MRTVLGSSEMVDETMPHRFYSPGEISNPDQQSKRSGRSTSRRSPRREHQKRVGKPGRQQDDRKPGSRSRLAVSRASRGRQPHTHIHSASVVDSERSNVVARPRMDRLVRIVGIQDRIANTRG